MSCLVEEVYTIEKPLNDNRFTFLDQVYKIVVQWSNGHSTIIYRRYSMFFDFMVSWYECKYFRKLTWDAIYRCLVKMGVGIEKEQYGWING